MAPPPAKRRRRNVLPSSSDDEDTASRNGPNTLSRYLVASPEKSSVKPVQDGSPTRPGLVSRPLRTSTAGNAGGSPSRRSNGKRSATNSPAKTRSRDAISTGRPDPTKPRNGDLKSLFSKQAERAPALSHAQLEDIVSDPISDGDGDGDIFVASTASRIGQNAKKRLKDGSQPVSSSTSHGQPTGSQMFVRPVRPTQDAVPDNEQRPWSERFGPVSLEELAVHKKKVADVRAWLEGVIAGRLRQRLLVLKGAAGTGKTTTMRLLAKDMKCELLEWRNPTGALASGPGVLSASAQFQEFLGRSGKFSQLDIGTADDDEQSDSKVKSMAPPPNRKSSDTKRKIILVEEFPNTFARSSTALTSFRNALLQYLIANTPSLAAFGQQTSSEPITPVVLVISETLLTTTSASADSFTAHRLLGPEISRHPGTCIIEFNAIAPTLLAAALELVVQKEARKSGRRKTPGPLVLKRLGEIGDIRSAVSSLEFLCLKGDNEADWGSKVAFTKPKRGAKSGVALTKGEVDSLELISQRESSLGIFHAVGKIVYNKREDLSMSSQTPSGLAESLPSYLSHNSRPRRSEVAVDELIDETGTDIQTFVSALHENYALSCEATSPSDPNSSLDYLNNCLDYLSDSDLLSPSWDVFFGGSGYGGRDSASHALRQDEIAYHVATRGLLFSLPYPVKRAKASGRPGGDAFKMFYPTSIKLWRGKEELEGLVDHWATSLLRGDESTRKLTEGASAFKKPVTGDSGDWISRQASQQRRNGTQQSTNHGQGQGQSAGSPLLSLGSSARREMLLERLPYMAHMARRRKLTLSSARLRELEKVVSFTGIGPPANEADEDGAEPAPAGAASSESWATDRPTEESSPRKKRTGLGIRQKPDDAVESSLMTVQKLVLSDDDIED
ncbi:Rad17 cell cycle checkpoint protein-domain-containing protein [Microdochium trichocladiopsis]|uniref:Rad17 cell cycle checkpoint protein-domain-containing protein n=1 Tax=Microdochium trichocladiopsis TaxID=1682393 RepID=A0A9P8Y652_9PEZI|nr:Rad17 cell cycle checkpoint protein-domain-containing protein [Microdochium trichocladiopsis]KAH7030984.1 Rad17 cell cycle checkpoint protein-domain-containing protein [Microdochium trichocladiopsis]